MSSNWLANHNHYFTLDSLLDKRITGQNLGESQVQPAAKNNGKFYLIGCHLSPRHAFSVPQEFSITDLPISFFSLARSFKFVGNVSMAFLKWLRLQKLEPFLKFLSHA